MQAQQQPLACICGPAYLGLVKNHLALAIRLNTGLPEAADLPMASSDCQSGRQCVSQMLTIPLHCLVGHSCWRDAMLRSITVRTCWHSAPANCSSKAHHLVYSEDYQLQSHDRVSSTVSTHGGFECLLRVYCNALLSTQTRSDKVPGRRLKIFPNVSDAVNSEW
jgi:hypothetical protein